MYVVINKHLVNLRSLTGSELSELLAALNLRVDAIKEELKLLEKEITRRKSGTMIDF